MFRVIRFLIRVTKRECVTSQVRKDVRGDCIYKVIKFINYYTKNSDKIF